MGNAGLTLTEAITQAIDEAHEHTKIKATSFVEEKDAEAIRKFVGSIKILPPSDESVAMVKYHSDNYYDGKREVQLEVYDKKLSKFLLEKEARNSSTRINDIYVEFIEPLYTELSTFSGTIRAAPNLETVGYKIARRCQDHIYWPEVPSMPGEKELLLQISMKSTLLAIDVNPEYASYLADPLYSNGSVAVMNLISAGQDPNPNANWRFNLCNIICILLRLKHRFVLSNSISKIDLLNQLAQRMLKFPHWIEDMNRFQDIKRLK